MNLLEVLQQQVLARPNAPAIIENHRTVTFRELDLLSGKAAALLQKSGIAPGDRVLVFQPMSIDLYVALLGIFRAGAVAMFLDPSAGKSHIEQCCEIAQPKGLIAMSKAHLLRLTTASLRRIPVQFSVGLPVPGARNWKALERLEPNPSVTSCDTDTPALLTFTSGSTGVPKAAVRSQGFLLTQHRVLQETLELIAGETDLTTLPIFVLANLASGVTSLLPNADLRNPGSIDPAPVLSQIKRYRPTSTVASPAFLHLLAEHCSRRGASLDSFAKIFSGGAPVFPSLLDQLREVAPQARIEAAYGSTEAEPISHIELSMISSKDFALMLDGNGLLVGEPVDGIRLAVIPDRWGQPLGPYGEAEFEKLHLDPGEIGEIVVSGDHVLEGYLDGQGDEETKFKVNGKVWHRTGDAGALDVQGRLWLFGRCSARIEDRRGVLYPFAVECALDREPGIRRTAFIQHEGLRTLALEKQVGYADISLDSLDWAHIDRVVVCQQIPVDKRHNAKIDYPALTRMLKERKNG